MLLSRWKLGETHENVALAGTLKLVNLLGKSGGFVSMSVFCGSMIYLFTALLMTFKFMCPSILVMKFTEASVISFGLDQTWIMSKAQKEEEQILSVTTYC